MADEASAKFKSTRFRDETRHAAPEFFFVSEIMKTVFADEFLVQGRQMHDFKKNANKMSFSNHFF